MNTDFILPVHIVKENNGEIKQNLPFQKEIVTVHGGK